MNVNYYKSTVYTVPVYKPVRNSVHVPVQVLLLYKYLCRYCFCTSTIWKVRVLLKAWNTVN